MDQLSPLENGQRYLGPKLCHVSPKQSLPVQVPCFRRSPKPVNWPAGRLVNWSGGFPRLSPHAGGIDDVTGCNLQNYTDPAFKKGIQPYALPSLPWRPKSAFSPTSCCRFGWPFGVSKAPAHSAKKKEGNFSWHITSEVVVCSR